MLENSNFLFSGSHFMFPEKHFPREASAKSIEKMQQNKLLTLMLQCMNHDLELDQTGVSYTQFLSKFGNLAQVFFTSREFSKSKNKKMLIFASLIEKLHSLYN